MAGSVALDAQVENDRILWKIWLSRERISSTEISSQYSISQLVPTGEDVFLASAISIWRSQSVAPLRTMTRCAVGCNRAAAARVSPEIR